MKHSVANSSLLARERMSARNWLSQVAGELASARTDNERSEHSTLQQSERMKAMSRAEQLQPQQEESGFYDDDDEEQKVTGRQEAGFDAANNRSSRNISGGDTSRKGELSSSSRNSKRKKSTESSSLGIIEFGSTTASEVRRITKLDFDGEMRTANVSQSV
jgi:hypothetical protein